LALSSDAARQEHLLKQAAEIELLPQAPQHKRV
jgi:hypothetical protein